MDAVMAAERALGNSRATFRPRKRAGTSRAAIRVPATCASSRSRDATPTRRDVIVTKNEILASLNAPDAFVLAIVQVDGGFAREPVYVRRFFQRELGFAETAVVFNLADLISLAPIGLASCNQGVRPGALMTPRK